MRRYKTITCILLILSVFSFVLAAPLAVREVDKASADGVDVKIGLGKRADVQEEDRVKNWLDQAQQKPSEEVPWSTQSQRQGSSLAPTYASGTHPNPPSSPGESKSPLLSTSGGAELSWNPEGETKSIQSWTSTENRPALSSEAESVSWTPSKDMMLSPSETVTPPLQSEFITLPTPPGREAYLAKMASQKSQIGHPSSPGYVLPLPPEREAYLDRMAAQKSSLGCFGCSSQPGSKGYSMVSKFFDKLRFRPRF
jgi:hypothetical protein